MESINSRNWHIKYYFEWLLALLLIIILLPLFIVIGLLEKIDGGKIFYKSIRIGKNGKPFVLYKFRGMIDGAKPIVSKELKFVTLKNDPRVTPLGKILRVGFDELAQLINIIKGDMCFIGPRPNLQWEKDLYDQREEKRLQVLPGITGLSQILDGRTMHMFDNYEIDVRYVEKSNLFTDIYIMLFTLPYSFGFKKFYLPLFEKYLKGLPCQRTQDAIDGTLEIKHSKETVYL